MPLERLSAEWQYAVQRILPIAPTAPHTSVPEGMVAIPAGDFRFAVSGVEIEGGGNNLYSNPYGVDVQYPFEPHPRRFHVQFVHVSPFVMDRYPVTQANYSAYLQATGTLPSDTWHYLANWNWTTTPPLPFPG